MYLSRLGLPADLAPTARNLAQITTSVTSQAIAPSGLSTRAVKAASQRAASAPSMAR